MFQILGDSNPVYYTHLEEIELQIHDCVLALAPPILTIPGIGAASAAVILSEIVGHEPDLISAVGTDGQAGYVKYEDVKKPEIKNPSEAVSYICLLYTSRCV